MARALTTQNVYEKVFKIFQFVGLFAQVFGCPETSGAWIIYGNEKNGKTWFALLLANYLSTFERIIYISAEEGLGNDFRESMKRAKTDPKNKALHWLEYLTMEELEAKLKSRKSPKIIFIDNLTVYADELKGGAFRKLLREHDDKLFIFLAHEEKGQPYGALGKMCKKLAKIIVHVEGLTAKISGRCPGGIVQIDETKSALYWGNN